MASKRFFICSAVFCIGFWMLFGFLVGSVSVVHLLHHGLEVDKNSVSMKTDKLYQPGRYMLGVRRTFIEFPTFQQIIIFSNSLQDEKKNMDGAQFKEDATFYPTINARSKEGLSVSFDVVIYFKIGLPSSPIPITEQLAKMYSEFGTNWVDLVQRLTTFEMRNVAAESNVLDYFQNRKVFGDDLRSALRASLEEFYVELKDVSIVSIKVPSALEDAITETEIVKQQVLTLNYTKQAKQIEADTRILTAQRDAAISLEIAAADGNISLITKTAIANATTTLLAQQISAFQQVAINLNFPVDTTLPDKLLTYFWIYIQRFNNVPQNSLGVGIPKTIQDI